MWVKCMMLNMKLEGFPEEVLNTIVDKGIASNKTEAIRLLILHYNEHYGIKQLSQYLEDQTVVRKVQFLEKEAKEGKRKTLSEEEALAKYKHLLK